MEFIVLGSGSSGNAYVIKDNNNFLLFECGFEFKKLVQKLHRNNIALNDIEAVCITHYHSDHSKSSLDIENYQIPVIHKEMPIFHKNPHFSISTFPVCHDIEAFGFVIKTENESVLFINDTSCCNLPTEVLEEKFDYVFIECNHTRRKLNELIENADEDMLIKYDRQKKYHLSLAGTKKMLSQLNLEKCKEIYLMHLSQEASEPEVMQQVVESTFKIKTHICLRNGGIQ